MPLKIRRVRKYHWVNRCLLLSLILMVSVGLWLTISTFLQSHLVPVSAILPEPMMAWPQETCCHSPKLTVSACTATGWQSVFWINCWTARFCKAKYIKWQYLKECYSKNSYLSIRFHKVYWRIKNRFTQKANSLLRTYQDILFWLIKQTMLTLKMVKKTLRLLHQKQEQSLNKGT